MQLISRVHIKQVSGIELSLQLGDFAMTNSFSRYSVSVINIISIVKIS